MLERFFYWCVSFLSIVSVAGIFMGYLGIIYTGLSVAVMILAAIVSVLAVRYLGLNNRRVDRFLVVMLLIVAVMYLVPVRDGTVYPHACSDIYNHVLSTRSVAYEHGFDVNETYVPFVYKHSYPLGYFGTSAMLYQLYPNSYAVNTLFPILLEILSVVALFFLVRNISDKKTAYLSVILYGFSIVQIWTLEQGYMPQIMGRFFMIALLYLISAKKKGLCHNCLVLLANVALFSYPHYAIIYLLILAFDFYRRRDLGLLKIFIMAFALIFFETVGIFVYYLFSGGGTVGLIRGGILVPNVFALAIFIFAIRPFIGILKDDNVRLLRYFVLALIIMMAFISSQFVIAILEGRGLSLVSLYTVVKYMYLMICPLSVFAAMGLKRYALRRPIIVIGMLVLYVGYFAGYAYIVPEKGNYPMGVYDAIERLHSLDGGEFIVGVDEQLLVNGWVQSFPYNSLFDIPNDYDVCPEIEASKALAFVWAERGYWDGRWHIIDSEGQEVFNSGSEGVDYFISSSILDEKVFYSSGGIFVYEMNDGSQ